MTSNALFALKKNVGNHYFTMANVRMLIIIHSNPK